MDEAGKRKNEGVGERKLINVTKAYKKNLN